MKNILQPIRTKSLKGVFIERFEELILSGKFEAGQKLPSERELAEFLGVSRPVVHEGLLELESRGLVTMKPRAGTVVNDYRTHGSLTILATLMNCYTGTLAEELLESLFNMRMLVESETARLAALNRTDEQLQIFRVMMKEWEDIDINSHNLEAATHLYFRFHHHVAMSSGNLFYPLLMNSFKNFYFGITQESFVDVSFIPSISSFHQKIVDGIARHDADFAVAAMKKLIVSGEIHLKSLLKKRNSERGNL